MADETPTQTLEERRLAFEERKWADEFSLRKIELENKARDSTLLARLFSPLTATIIVGILTVGGSVTATLLQNANSLRLEQTKYDTTKELEERKFVSSKQLDTQKQQHEMILKMIGVDNVEQARSNLRFLAETQLITDKDLAQRLLAAKETPLIRPPTAAPSSVTIIPPVTPEEFKRRVSEDAIKLIVESEIGTRKVYEEKLTHPYAFGSFSGVNIGFGYDLSVVSVEKFKSDWASYLDDATVNRLVVAVGVRGEAAEPLAKKLADITIRWDDAMAVLVGKDLPEWATRMERALPNLSDLPPDSYGALLSLAYNTGTNFNTAGGRNEGKRKIRELMEARQYNDVPEQFRVLARAASIPGIARRREAEAKLFEKGLGRQ